MGKRLLYICRRENVANCLMYPNAVGVQNKVDIQRYYFEKLGYKVQYGILDDLPQNILPVLTDINLFSTSINWERIDMEKPIDVVYIRFGRNVIESGLIVLLQKIKRKNKNVKVLFEFQTFPFYKDYYFKNREFTYYRYCIFVRLLRFYVDRIVLCTSGYKKLYGINVLYMPNGVKYKEKRIIVQNHEDNEIHLIAVSSMLESHGYDRLIKGMGTYYKQGQERKVILHLVGDGSQKDNYVRLAKRYGINDYIIFEGICTGERLNYLYLLADIGIDGFGNHRMAKNLVSSALKLKEEASYGLPIIGSGDTDMDCEPCMKYFLKFPADDTEIDVNKIITFYDEVYNDDKEIVRNTIKEVLRPYYDIEEALKEVLEYMEA